MNKMNEETVLKPIGFNQMAPQKILVTEHPNKIWYYKKHRKRHGII